MHSLLKKMVLGSAIVGGVQSAVVRGAPPAITEAPSAAEVLAKRQEPDPVSLGLILLTGVPESLREIAATNLPELSSVLWSEFLGDSKPDWFLELPLEIQNYFIGKFGPQTAWPTEAPIRSGFGASSGFTVTVTVSASATDSVEEPSQTTQPSGTSKGSSQTVSGPTGTSAESTPSSATSISSNRSSELTSFATSYTTASSQSSVSARSTSQSSASTSRLSTTSSLTKVANPTGTPSALPAPEVSDDGLSKNQKIGLGLGIPLSVLAAAALLFGCCIFCRRRQKKNVEGSIPPESPGFIPRFAFQEKYNENVEHRTPLTRDMNRSTHDFGSTWDDEGVDPMDTIQNPFAWNNSGAYHQIDAPAQAPAAASSEYSAVENEGDRNNYSNVPVMMVQDPKPVMAPALYHTHSSNRARGKRTSYSSLRSVAEVKEPDEIESPILGRHVSHSHSPPRNLMATPSIPAGAQIRRKPVPSSPLLAPLRISPLPVATSPAAQAASHTLKRQTMPEHSGSSSSGLALTTSSGVSSESSLAVHAEPTSPVSPISNRTPSNPFNYDSYVEDYGSEYQNGYVDVDDGLYGGNTSLSRYPESRRKNSKTEWPLRNLVGSRRKSSPIWERIYEE
ncbi:hypothetical protein BU23DRAFT_277104 [Bimuria novae-zelandiae CBS 107.79]|uniref:Mid2 domain-containing protein n=1 Tax=Bimuria novae-zelandiae CBS 107.79 TaxID=1447943 RepID=A0A6A5VXR9_9PLEO|nr:hypothetical protein BU23DRAFT_277104 [Bimuria novae-zelandiae CBS 107.79]